MFLKKMIRKAERGNYTMQPQVLRADFERMCTNAMHFYKTNHPIYHAAKLLMTKGNFILDKLFPSTITDNLDKYLELMVPETLIFGELALQLPTSLEIDPNA